MLWSSTFTYNIIYEVDLNNLTYAGEGSSAKFLEIDHDTQQVGQ